LLAACAAPTQRKPQAKPLVFNALKPPTKFGAGKFCRFAQRKNKKSKNFQGAENLCST